MELCLFDAEGGERRIPLPEVDAFVWHVFLRLARIPDGMEPGQRYGFRMHGPYDPGRGLRCNPHKLLLDPYAKAIGPVISTADAQPDEVWMVEAGAVILVPERSVIRLSASLVCRGGWSAGAVGQCLVTMVRVVHRPGLQ